MKGYGKNRFRIFGFGFIVFGIVWSLLSKFFCNSICNNCGVEIKPCYFLFLFVGIIFVVNGASIILIWGLKRKMIKKEKE